MSDSQRNGDSKRIGRITRITEPLLAKSNSIRLIPKDASFLNGWCPNTAGVRRGVAKTACRQAYTYRLRYGHDPFQRVPLR